jgi:hypothetical protein
MDGWYLDMARVGHEMQRFVLVPLGELAAAVDEAELLALGDLRHEGLLEGPGGGEGVVDVDPLVGVGVGELSGAPADGPSALSVY